MEKQWQQDERNPEFPFLRKAWRRNISALWDQIWKKLNYKKRSLSSYLAGDEISQNLYDTSHDEMEFPSHMDDVFLYSKQPATIPAVEESIAYPDLDLLSVAAKKKPAKKPAESPAFPADLRHFRYLPVFPRETSHLGDSHGVTFERFGSICAANEHVETPQIDWRT